MKTIPVGKNGHLALVDDEDYEELSQVKWSLHKSSNYSRTFYARRWWKVDNVRHTEYMHKRITGFKQTDHINNNGLDNRKQNLREADPTQNLANSPKRNGAYTSSYRGVYWLKRIEKWVARISYNNINKYLGSFENEIEAAKAYDAAARKHFGEFAHPNFEV